MNKGIRFDEESTVGRSEMVATPPIWRQLILFVGCYGLFNYVYFQIPDELYSDVIYHYGVVLLCADLINAVAPLEHVAAIKNHLLSLRADLEIVRGCDSAGVLFLMISAILVFPASLLHKALGFIYGIVLIYCFNILRVSGLYFLIAYHRDWFEFVHLYLAPTLITLAACIFYAWWAFGSKDVAQSS